MARPRARAQSHLFLAVRRFARVVARMQLEGRESLQRAKEHFAIESDANRTCSDAKKKSGRETLAFFPGILEGLGNSGKLVGIISTYPGTSPTLWCRIMIKK